MTIDLYPAIIKKDDLSPDEGFGPEIDEDCQVSRCLDDRLATSRGIQ